MARLLDLNLKCADSQASAQMAEEFSISPHHTHLSRQPWKTM